jgi:hypothetical protein
LTASAVRALDRSMSALPEFVNRQSVCVDCLTGLCRDLMVVAEQQHLGLIGECVEHPQARLGSLIVEIDEEVVEHEGKWSPSFHELLKSGDP